MWFLYKNGLINEAIVSNWVSVNEKQTGEKLNPEQDLKASAGANNILFAAPIIFCMFSWLFRNEPFAAFAKYILVAMLVIGVIVVWMILLYSELARDLNRLNELFVQNCYEQRIPRRLHIVIGDEYIRLEEFGQKLASRLAKGLREFEVIHGVDHPLSNSARKSFKDAHAIMVPFCLCDEDQGKYLRTKIPNDPQTSPEDLVAQEI
jgi:hypothetical protein